MNILIVSPGNISIPHGGAANRIFNLANQLQKNYNVIVLEPNISKDATQSQSNFIIHTYFGTAGNLNFSTFSDINPFFIEKLIRIITKYKIDLVQVEFPWGVFVTKIVSNIFRKNTKVIYDSHNYQSRLQHDLSEYYKKNTSNKFDIVVSTLIALYTKLIEPLAVFTSDYTLCVSDSDLRQFAENYKVDVSKLKIIPNGTTLFSIQNSKDSLSKYNNLDKSKFKIVFHGSYEYPPNNEAISIIITKIMPAITKDIPNILFIIAGPGVPSYDNSNLKCLGFVEDIFSLIKTCDLAIVPIISGGGTKLKLLDYLSAGLPIVTTKKGAEGLNIKNGEHAIIVDNADDEFIKAIKLLYYDKQQRINLGKNAHKLAEEYDWNTIGENLRLFYSSLSYDG